MTDLSSHQARLSPMEPSTPQDGGFPLSRQNPDSRQLISFTIYTTIILKKIIFRVHHNIQNHIAMSDAPNIPWENPSTVFVNEDGQLTPPPSPVLIANAGLTNGAESSVNMTDGDVSDESETLSSDGGSQLGFGVQPMTGAVGDESSGFEDSVGESSYHQGPPPNLIIHTAAGDLYAHQNVLSQNETFSRLLIDSPATLDMRDESPSAVEILVRYIYNPLTSIILPDTPITHFSEVARLAEVFEIWDLAYRAEQAIPLSLPERTLPEFIAGFRDAFLAEETSESNRNIQRIFLDEACVRMSALIANLEFRNFLDSHPLLAVDILQRLYMGPPRPLPQYVSQACERCLNAWSTVSPGGLQYCPFCGWGLGSEV
ncbi:hypothetical protein P168DRAFT_83318 [Aspergillus campestris IBT 28561]|uniref:BTB domain-containing protein n=1 Tax=Aspergillus campestris (strain IBT 28561) TaxID=1392248 RepID=A0A2I1CQH4_ASPC2|nr:uncharacterized protein P168DRAFT_83318 [Aspergillus campestris IBT 28561]PKX99855.1 hypothetical protein P168DRAFT_83318 [Aspergillus campestris IBT 28561]